MNWLNKRLKNFSAKLFSILTVILLFSTLPDFFSSSSESPWKPKRHAGGSNVFVPKNKYEELILVKKHFNCGAAQHRGSILASHPAALGSIPSISEFFQRKNYLCC